MIRIPKKPDCLLPASILALVVAACVPAMAARPLSPRSFVRSPTVPPPSVLFGDLFRRIALERIFSDSKSWADAVPRQSPQSITADYRRTNPRSRASLELFVARHFARPEQPAIQMPLPGLSLSRHVDALWSLLTRSTDKVPPFSSALALPHPYVVPGGRFREIYYWDSYFTMLGLGPGRLATKRDMVKNFAYLIDSYGHVPNGSRTYYLSRSQPPFFFKMVALTDPADPAKAFAAYLPQLKREHAFWMKGASTLRSGNANLRVVRMADGAILNRYWDDRAAPRDESYVEDYQLAAKAGARKQVLYRNIRAAAESGWDFSSRWLAGDSLATLQTTDIVPPDLNSLLYGLEQAIEQGCARLRDRQCADSFHSAALARKAAILRYLWNDRTGVFDDYQWRQRRLLGNLSAATAYPLFFQIASESQARRVALTMERQLLKQGGLASTDRSTGQQWDMPNGWAPLQWVAVVGLRNYRQDRLAKTIADRWVRLVSDVYLHNGKLLEKYNVQDPGPGGGGEYPLQDGFGWTNGVTVAFFDLYPEFAAASDGILKKEASPPAAK